MAVLQALPNRKPPQHLCMVRLEPGHAPFPPDIWIGAGQHSFTFVTPDHTQFLPPSQVGAGPCPFSPVGPVYAASSPEGPRFGSAQVSLHHVAGLRLGCPLLLWVWPSVALLGSGHRRIGHCLSGLPAEEVEYYCHKQSTVLNYERTMGFCSWEACQDHQHLRCCPVVLKDFCLGAEGKDKCNEFVTLIPFPLSQSA